MLLNAYFSAKIKKYRSISKILIDPGFWLPELGSKMSVASKALCSNAFSGIVKHSPKAKLTVVRVANNDC